MDDSLRSLSEREKETLRLLLRGHDAKSIARELGLSVHTINERLRDTRRKLGVSSSREAARLLAEAERLTPNSLGDKDFGVAGRAVDMASGRQGAGRSLAWLVGGTVIMSLVIIAAALSSGLLGGPAKAPSAESHPVAESVSPSPSAAAAREWIALVDDRRWDDSWRAAAAAFRSQVTAAQWASSVRSVREPLGTVSSRAVQTVTRTSSLPGAPAGEYEVIQFQTSFTQRSAVETIVMMREGGAWKVSGYFVR